jgi:uncharacterized protein (TIGR02246 family)
MRYTQLLTSLVGLLVPLITQAQIQAVRPRSGSVTRYHFVSDEAAIRQWLDRWAKAAQARDVDAIMSLYAPDVVAYDIVPPLQYVGKAAYRKDYQEFLGQYQGSLEIEYRDLHIAAGNKLAYAAALERISGTLKNGQKSSIWVRFTSIYRKTNGKWLDMQDHVSVPTDLETGKAALDLTP